MTAMLKTVITNGTGAGANIGKPAAGKTGTTDDNKDAYFVGYTPNIVTGVWVGSDDNSVMSKGIQGGTVPAIIWKDIMKIATEPYGSLDFNYPKVVLEPFQLNSANIKIIEQGAEENIDEENPDENLNENTDETKTQINPQDVLKNVKSTIQPVSQPVAQPAARPSVPQQKPAPTPIPMAVPESLN